MENICGFCEEDYTQPIQNNSCKHNYHGVCLEKYILNLIHQNSLKIQCPYEECSHTLDLSLLNSLNPQLYEKFIESTFKVYKQINGSLVQCPTVNCPYVLEFKACERKITNKNSKCQQCKKYICKCFKDFKCPVCNIVFCLYCKAEHNGLTCFQYMSNKNIDYNFVEFVKFLKDSKSRKCPNCNFWVEKTQGCNHMVCKCKFEFCYNCNGIYNKCSCKNLPVSNQKIDFPKIPIVYKKVIIRNTQRKEKINKPKQQIVKPKNFNFSLIVDKNRSITTFKK